MKYLLLVLLIFSGCKDSEVVQEGNQLGRQRDNLCMDPPPSDPILVIEGAFSQLMSSTARRDVGSEVLTLEEERKLAQNSALPPNYNEEVDHTTDEDGYRDTNVIKMERPEEDCGLEQESIADKIADCSEKNPERSKWDGKTNATFGEGSWTLVRRLKFTKDNIKEIWRDDRTGLLWSSDLGEMNWCQVTGNQQEPVSRNQQIIVKCKLYGNSENSCSTEGTSSEAKGGEEMDRAVAWRVPTRHDFYMAEINGLRHVLPNSDLNLFFWTSTTVSSDKTKAWTFSHRDGNTKAVTKINNQIRTRCVGRGE